VNYKIFDLVIADEVHKMGTTRLIKVLNHKFKYKIGLSATPDRSDFKHWEIYKCFNYNIFEYEIGQAIEDKVLNTYNLYDISVAMDENCKMQYEELSIAMGNIMRSIGGWHAFKTLPASDKRKLALMGVLDKRKKLIWNYKPKLDLVVKLCKANPDRKIIIFSQFNSVTNALFYYLGAEKIKAGVFHSGIHEKQRRHTLMRFRMGLLNVLLATKVLDEGLDIKGIDMGIILAGERTERQTIQRLGRVLRKKDKESLLFQLFVKDTFEEEVALEKSVFLKQFASVYERIET
jgi:RNA polymerase primary sigma factor